MSTPAFFNRIGQFKTKVTADGVFDAFNRGAAQLQDLARPLCRQTSAALGPGIECVVSELQSCSDHALNFGDNCFRLFGTDGTIYPSIQMA